MRKMLFVPALLIASVLSGCIVTAEQVRERMYAWVGVAEQKLISQKGPPSSVYTMSSGDRVLTYSYDQKIQTGGGTRTVPTTTTATGRHSFVGSSGYRTVDSSYTVHGQQVVVEPVQSFSLTCEASFTVSDGYITDVSWRGNNCGAHAKLPILW